MSCCANEKIVVELVVLNMIESKRCEDIIYDNEMRVIKFHSLLFHD